MSRFPRTESVSWRYSAYGLLIPILLLYVLSLTGCVSDSPGLHNIFLIRLFYGDANSTSSDADVEVRVGYFGLCLKSGSGTNCHSSAFTTPERLSTQFNSSSEVDTNDASHIDMLVTLGLILQSKVYLQLFAAAGAFFLISTIIFILSQWKEKRAAKKAENASTGRTKSGLIAILWTSVGLGITSSVAITQVSSALQFGTSTSITGVASRSDIIMKAGIALQVLQWITVGFSTLFALAISSIIRRTSAGLPGPGGPGTYKGGAGPQALPLRPQPGARQPGARPVRPQPGTTAAPARPVRPQPGAAAAPARTA